MFKLEEGKTHSLECMQEHILRSITIDTKACYYKSTFFTHYIFKQHNIIFQTI